MSLGFYYSYVSVRKLIDIESATDKVKGHNRYLYWCCVVLSVVIPVAVLVEALWLPFSCCPTQLADQRAAVTGFVWACFALCLTTAFYLLPGQGEDLNYMLSKELKAAVKEIQKKEKEIQENQKEIQENQKEIQAVKKENDELKTQLKARKKKKTK